MNRKEFKKLLIEWNQLLCEGSGSESKILYHGSPYKFDKFKAKSHFLADDKPVVFGTPIRSIAIASLCVWTDEDLASAKDYFNKITIDDKDVLEDPYSTNPNQELNKDLSLKSLYNV